MVALIATESATSRPRNRSSARTRGLVHSETCGPARAGGVSGLRYFQPDTGRWISRDPLAERGGVNIYVFVQNGTINKIDNIGLAVPVIVVGGVVLTAAEAAAAAFGLSLGACLMNPDCAAAVQKAVKDALAGLGDTALELLRFRCKNIYAEYKRTHALCEGCEPKRARCLVDRLVRCAKGGAMAACWAKVIAGRLEYAASGCEFILEEENWSGHAKAIEEEGKAAAKCAESALNNCPTIFNIWDL